MKKSISSKLVTKIMFTRRFRGIRIIQHIRKRTYPLNWYFIENYNTKIGIVLNGGPNAIFLIYNKNLNLAFLLIVQFQIISNDLKNCIF